MKLVRIRFLVVAIEVPDLYPFKVDEKVVQAKDLEVGNEVVLFGRVQEINKDNEIPMFNEIPQMKERFVRLEKFNMKLIWLLMLSPVLYFLITALFRFISTLD